MPSVRFGSKTIKLPSSRPFRIAIGIALCLGGFVGFLPILGFWMVPLGLLVLSVDIPVVRKVQRRTTVFVSRWWKGSSPAARYTAIASFMVAAIAAAGIVAYRLIWAS